MLTWPSDAIVRALAACAIAGAVFALVNRPSRAADDPPPSDALMCVAPTETGIPDLSSATRIAPLFPETDTSALLPSPSTGSIPGGERSPFDDLDDDPPMPALPPSSLTLPPSTDKPYWRSNFFKRVLTDQAFIVTKWWPSEIRRWSFSGPLLASTALAARSADDENAFDFMLSSDVDEDTEGGSDKVAMVFTKLGNGLPASAALGIMYLVGRHTGNDRLAEASSVSFEALLSSGLWVEIIKKATSRERPVHDSHGKFFQYGESNSNSFPSGHAMGAFTIATVFAHVYADKKWVPWVAYGTAGLIGASRVALGRHFPSDVIAGAILGNSIGRMALTRDGREGPLSPGRFQPIFDPSKKQIGVAYSYSW